MCTSSAATELTGVDYFTTPVGGEARPVTDEDMALFMYYYY